MVYRLQLKDKKNSSYSIGNPSAFLSQKAIERRQKSFIPITEEDLPVSAIYLDSIKQSGVIIHNISKWFNSVTIISDSSSINKIKNFHFIDKIENIGYLYRGKKKNIANTNKNTSTISYSNNSNSCVYNDNNKIYDYGMGFEQIDMLGGVCLHNAGFDGKNVTIAVFDAGFSNVDNLSFFYDLWTNGRILGTRDFVDTNISVFRKATHGLYVLSVMAANINGVFVGTAPKANYWLICTEDAYSESPIEEDNWVSGAEFADSAGVDIISSSLSYTKFDDTSLGHWYNELDGKTIRITLAAEMAIRKGMIVVNSAGNSGGNSAWQYIGAPADGENVLTVAAVDLHRRYAPFSSIGPTADGRIKPDVAALGKNVTLVSPANSLTSGSGTSFATPLISGLIACLIQAHPDKSNLQIINAVKLSADKYNKPDNFTGYGIPNFALAHIMLSEQVLKNKTFNHFYNDICTFFESSEEEQITLEVFDIVGKRVFFDDKSMVKQGYNYFYISNLDKLAKGLYFVRMFSKNKTVSYKLLKQ